MSSTFFLFLFAPTRYTYTRSDSAVNYIRNVVRMYIPKIMIKEISCMGERMFTEAEISILE